MYQQDIVINPTNFKLQRTIFCWQYDLCKFFSSPIFCVTFWHILSAVIIFFQRAEYFCNEPDSHHYALNIDMYTHFTSPIRRYCDIVVHRILCSILGHNEIPSWDTYDVKQ